MLGPGVAWPLRMPRIRVNQGHLRWHFCLWEDAAKSSGYTTLARLLMFGLGGRSGRIASLPLTYAVQKRFCSFVKGTDLLCFKLSDKYCQTKMGETKERR